MGRTFRHNPHGFFRRPRNQRVKIEREATNDALQTEGFTAPNRHQLPSDDRDDLSVSDELGQAWTPKLKGKKRNQYLRRQKVRAGRKARQHGFVTGDFNV